MCTPYTESQKMVAMASSLRTSRSAMSYEFIRQLDPENPSLESNIVPLAITQPKL